MSDELALLMAVRVQGITKPDRSAAALGIDAASIAERLEALAAAGLAMQRSGRMTGFTLTPAGSTRLDKLLADEGLRTSDEMAACYDKFMLLNNRVLKVSSDWQVRTDGAVEQPNDHSDAEYDESVVLRLVDLHARASSCVEGLADCAARFGPYGSRLDDCVRRLRKGDVKAFTAPLAESYHTVWFELHQDLLLTLGREREE